MRLRFIKKFDKNSTSSMIAYLGSAQTISYIIRITSGILVARFVLPEMLGTFNGIGIILGYLPIFQLGVMNGLNRELPYYFGKGEKEKAKDFASVAQFWEVSLSAISFTIMSLIAFYYLIQGQYLYASGFFAFALSSIFHFYGQNYLQILFRTNSDFNKLSNIAIIISVVSLLSVILVWKWQYYGLCIRSILMVMIEIYLLWIWKPLKVLPKWNTGVMKEIVRVGMPIFIVGLIYALWTTLQNTLVLKLGSAEQFGFFALAIMIENSMAIAMHSLDQVIYPKMAYEYGSGKKVGDLLHISFKPILYVFCGLIPVIAVGWVVLPFAIDLLLPRYMNGIEAARWTMLLILVSVWTVNNNIFNVLQKQRDLLVSILIGMFVFTIAVLILNKMNGFSLSAFPQAMIVGKTTQLIVAYFFIRKYKKNQHILI